MLTLTVGEFKARFSDVLQELKSGEKVAITYGRAKKIVAYLVANEPKATKRKLGILSSKQKIGQLAKIDTLNEFGL